jgi:predicted Rossmann fold nucleotide-binding protein DprA/Smf involved in DNA uptake
LSERLKISPEKAKEIQERNKERNLIVQAMKNGSSTVEEISKTTGIEKSQVLRNLIAMRAFGKVQIAGDKDNQIVYNLPQEG